MTIRYKSDNGYSGSLYGKSSMSIYGPDGKEIMHTGYRTPNTRTELKEIVDGMPDFVRMLRKTMKDIDTDKPQRMGSEEYVD